MLTNTQKPVYDGGPAYPCGKSDQSGMSLRDYFAAQVVNALLASGEAAPWNLIAENAYRMADAMLDAREQVKT